jgi:hypothetical protein
MLQQKYSSDTLRAIHQSLNVQDRLTALIRKERILQYPAGTDLAGIYTVLLLHMLGLYRLGVQREFSVDRHKSNEEQWIREIYYLDRQHYMVICCTFKQAKAFMATRHLEIDLSFKMVQGNVNLFTIAGYDEDAKRRCSIWYTYIQHMCH